MRLLLVLVLLLSASGAVSQTSSFSYRREAIREALSPRSAVLAVTSPVYRRNGDVDHEFRPDSDFWYLTGCSDPKAALLLLGANTSSGAREILFTPPRFLKEEVWTGPRPSPEEWALKLGINRALPTDSLSQILKGLQSAIDTLYVGPSLHGQPISSALELIPEEARSSWTVLPLAPLVTPHRHIKSAEEIQHLQKAVDITGEALRMGMRRAEPGLMENQIQATIEFAFRDAGSRRNGFPSIIGSGPNATILHYTNNNRTLQSGDLLLMDVGAEVEMYTADVTRTVPVSGKFSAAQAELYQHVREAQDRAFDSLRHGMTLRDLHRVAKAYLDSAGFGQYFIHGLSHWLGLDVHDVGGREARIETGSVFTIEPGIYIAPDDTTAAERYRGIGIRIEDVVVMTEKGPLWMSAGIPREIREIENLMKRRR